MKTEMISYKYNNNTSETSTNDSLNLSEFFLDLNDILLDSKSKDKFDENSKIRFSKYADNIYKNYILIIKSSCFKDINSSSNPVLFINCLIAIKIINSFKINKKELVDYNATLKKYIKSQNHKIDNDILYNLDYISISNLAKSFGIEINTDELNKIIKLIERMNLVNIVDLDKKNLNKILGLVFEKFITKKEIGAYYTGENTTTYITENTLIASIIKNWSKKDKNLGKYLNFYEKQNNISLIENAILKNISLKSILFSIASRFDNKKLIETIKKLTIIDISCGSGSFIFSAYFLLNEIINETSNSEIQLFDIEIFKNNLFGIDIDIDAICIIKYRIFIQVLLDGKKCNDFDELLNNFILGNSLLNNKQIIKNADIVDSVSTSKNKGKNSLFESNVHLNKVILNNGFDVVLGNPPYLEYKNVKEDYRIENFKSEKCNNLYAFILEKNFDILKEGGHMGMIIPISYVSTKRMKPIRKLLSLNSSYQFCSNFADRPSCLFNGVHQKLNIILLEKQTLNYSSNLYTTNYLHWYSEEKENIYQNISYIKNDLINEDFIFKIGNSIENSIINKLSFNKNKSLLENTSSDGFFKVWLNMRMTFWNKSFLFSQKSSEYKIFCFDSEIDSILFSALLNSNLFFFYWECISDVWHITLKDLTNLKINFNNFDTKLKNEIVLLYKELEVNLETNKKRVNTKQTEFEYQHKKDKFIIDKIDLKFKKYFSLSDEEIEYIRLYQLKFRLNAEIDEYNKNYKK